jgi:hypothetical protein
LVCPEALFLCFSFSCPLNPQLAKDYLLFHFGAIVDSLMLPVVVGSSDEKKLPEF